MCICRQPPIHLYDPDYSFVANISHDLAGWIGVLWRKWSGAPATTYRFGFVDCSCSDDYFSSSFHGILANTGHLTLTLAGFVLILIAPIALGLAKRIGARHLRRVLIAWFALILWSFAVGLSQSHVFGRIGQNWALDAIPHIPLQLGFDVLVLLVLPALPVFLADRGVALIQRRFTAPI
ncbi:MAG TPA: hypothetical protein VF481_20980 [Novosphingobium sp.]